MHRFHLAPDDWASAALTGSEAHHARGVLRLQPGDRVVLFDGNGREATAEITALDSTAVQLRVLQETVTPPLGACIALAQAVPKGKNMDFIVQKSVEIGATEVFPLLSARTVVQLDPKNAKQKQAKWQTVALEAAKQCGQNWLPQVHIPRTLEDFFREIESGTSPVGEGEGRPPANSSSGSPVKSLRRVRSPLRFDLRLIGSLQPGARHLKAILADYADAHDGKRPERVLMLIGPEGDFTPAEIALARSRGCLPLTLGPIILRVETAAIYCLSILSYELLGQGTVRQR